MQTKHILDRRQIIRSNSMGARISRLIELVAETCEEIKLARCRLDSLLLYTGRIVSLSARALLRALRYRSLRPLWALGAGWLLAQGRDPA